MSGIKRKLEGSDPDYEDITGLVHNNNKRSKTAEYNARETTVQKIETIIRQQFSLEMKNKEHEIDVISQRLNEARRMMDKLRACIVANYYANAGITKLPEHTQKSDPAMLNHPAIRRFLESPSRSSSPLNQDSETPSLVPSESESLSQQGEGSDRNGEGAWREDWSKQERRPGRNTGRVSTEMSESRFDEASRLYVKKTIVVGNVSRYIPPDKREENDQSTHKWMVYVRGSRREPSIDHFVKKVWFFLHPSYKPNDLVEVSEPPFHLTRRGWGEFPVRIQIHFKDSRNKRIDIIHQLKLDRTYTGLQTLGAETVVDVELHRDSVSVDYIPQPSSSRGAQRTASPMSASSLAPSYGHSSLIKAEAASPVRGHSSSLTAGERTPTRPKAGDRVTLGYHGNSAFQPITSSCKIVPQGQPPSPAESPGKLFQPITMSCKIVSGSPISTPSHSPLPRTSAASTPAHSKQSSSSVLNNPYVIVDKPGQVVGMATSSTASSGTPSAKQSMNTSSFIFILHPNNPPCNLKTVKNMLQQISEGLARFVFYGRCVACLSHFCSVQVIIKQEPGEVSTQQQQMVSTVTSQQQPASTAAHQFVAVKGGHMVSMSSQKQAGGATGAATSKMLGVPVGSMLQSSVKQVAISSGQILVAKGNPSVSKVMGGKQVLAQGVAKAIVSGASGASGQQVGSRAASGSGVMATLQLPANNLANLANLPPGTKLYLTTNSKNPSGKGKLLLIPQGAILRASTATGGSQNSSSSGSLPSNLSYTSYILKQTPQVCVLFGIACFPAHVWDYSGYVRSPHTCHQAVVSSSQGAHLKLSDGSVKTVTAAGVGHMSKAGTTTFRMTGGVITAASSTPISTQHSISFCGVVSQRSGSWSRKNKCCTVRCGGTHHNLQSYVYAQHMGVQMISPCGFWPGMLKIQSAGSSSQQTVLTIPATQLKQLGVGTGSAGLQSIFMPVSKGAVAAGPSPLATAAAPAPVHVASAATTVKQEQGTDNSAHCLINTEHIETMMQLLTAVVKKFPLIVPEKTEDSHPFCASSVEQYYSWNIGKRRASELQRAVAVKRLVQDVLDRSPRLQALTPPKTKEVVQWCRQRGYTPPDPEPQHRNEDESIEDILTQIDSEPECPSTLSNYEELVQRLEQMQALLKTEPEEADDEIVDIVTVTPPCQRLKVKEEEQETDVEPKFYLGPCISSQFVSETAQQIGVSFQPVEVEKNVFAPVVEAMILKATQQFASDILREALAGAHAKSSPNRTPREVTAMNVHQAVCSIPTCDFLTNSHMGCLTKDD
uniref:YEATS domain-containing protein 2 n=1 Tax=Nothobranchius furzeri TaxID=105023 RepID=A0A8C6PS73_NOTFU